MGITYTNGISILELIAYLPSFFISAFLVYRHGLRSSGGFIFLTIFTFVRIIGACCQLATIKNNSTGIYIAAAICSSIGLSPLLMACSGMLSRANESMSRPLLPRISFTGFRIITIVALALTVTGITWNMTPEALKTPNTDVKIGMILYFVSWVVLCVGLVVLFFTRSKIAEGEHRNLLAVGISIPFLLIRTVYAILVFFEANNTFNALDGNTTVQLVMSVLMEMVIVFVCLGIGFTLYVREKNWKSVPNKEVEAREALP